MSDGLAEAPKRAEERGVAQVVCSAEHAAARAKHGAERAAAQVAPDTAAVALRADRDAERVANSFQQEMWSVLARQVQLYTLGESTSLPEYEAHRLLASTCFVLGVDPNNLDSLALGELLEEGVEAAFQRGLRQVEGEVKRAKALWESVVRSTPLLESVALKDTLESLRNFPARYDVRFFAHEIPADIDYPPCFPVSETLLGVSYVNEYLERLLMENRFMQLFDVERCRMVLCAVHPSYGELIVNLFEPIAANAIGCALAGCDVRALRVGAPDRACIMDALAGCSSARIAERLERAATKACDGLDVSGEDLRRYLGCLARALAPRVEMALQRNDSASLGGVFLSW